MTSNAAHLDIELPTVDISLESIEEMDDSVLGAALRRMHREARQIADGTANHTNTTHTDSHSNSGPW